VRAAELLAELGVETAPSILCRTADEAVAAATAFPVVVKLAEAAHRTELGGVRLGIADAAEVEAAAADLLRQGPVLVQRQLSGVEIAVGAVRDPVFGPVVMVGLGGIWVEVLGDVAFAMAPLHRAEARSLLESLRAAALLTGARGGTAVDLDALADVVVAAGNLLLACPDVTELDLNPVLATAEGAVAVDWKIGVAQP
jgi:acetyltransferase